MEKLKEKTPLVCPVREQTTMREHGGKFHKTQQPVFICFLIINVLTVLVLLNIYQSNRSLNELTTVMETLESDVKYVGRMHRLLLKKHQEYEQKLLLGNLEKTAQSVNRTEVKLNLIWKRTDNSNSFLRICIGHINRSTFRDIWTGWNFCVASTPKIITSALIVPPADILCTSGWCHCYNQCFRVVPTSSYFFRVVALPLYLVLPSSVPAYSRYFRVASLSIVRTSVWLLCL